MRARPVSTCRLPTSSCSSARRSTSSLVSFAVGTGWVTAVRAAVAAPPTPGSSSFCFRRLAVHGNNFFVSHYFSCLGFRFFDSSRRTYSGLFDCYWVTRDDHILSADLHSFLMPLRSPHAANANLLFQEQAPFDDQNLFHHRDDQRISFFSNLGSTFHCRSHRCP